MWVCGVVLWDVGVWGWDVGCGRVVWDLGCWCGTWPGGDEIGMNIVHCADSVENLEESYLG